MYIPLILFLTPLDGKRSPVPAKIKWKVDPKIKVAEPLSVSGIKREIFARSAGSFKRAQKTQSGNGSARGVNHTWRFYSDHWRKR
jgi:hypothetical protein